MPIIPAAIGIAVIVCLLMNVKNLMRRVASVLLVAAVVLAVYAIYGGDFGAAAVDLLRVFYLAALWLSEHIISIYNAVTSN